MAINHPNSNSCIVYNDTESYTIVSDLKRVVCGFTDLSFNNNNECADCNADNPYCLPFISTDKFMYQVSLRELDEVNPITFSTFVNGVLSQTLTPKWSWCKKDDLYTLNIEVDFSLITDECFYFRFDINTTNIITPLIQLYSQRYCKVKCNEYTILLDSLYSSVDCNGYTYQTIELKPLGDCDRYSGNTTIPIKYSNRLRIYGRMFYEGYNIETTVNDLYKEKSKVLTDTYFFRCHKFLPTYLVHKFKSVILGKNIQIREYREDVMIGSGEYLVFKGTSINNEQGSQWNVVQEFNKKCSSIDC